MLIVRCEEHLTKVRAKAGEMGIGEKLEGWLKYLGGLGGADSRVMLMSDFAPLSFYFEIYRAGSDRCWMNGGCIFFPADNDWSVHT